MYRAIIKQTVNTASLILTLLINYLSNYRIFNNQTIAEVGHKYESLFAPAGYAFSIWGLIYLLLIFFVIYNWYVLIKEKTDHWIHKIGPWFTLSNIANASWVLAWTNEYIGLSLIIIFILLISLIVLARNLELEITDPPVSIIFFIWWPVCLYLGWMIVAVIANAFAYLSSLHLNIRGIWTIIMIAICTFTYCLLIYKRNLREAAMVGAWALIAIAYKQWHEHIGIVTIAIIGSIVLLSYASYHAYKNRATSPFQKLLR